MQTLSKSQAWKDLQKHFDRVVDGIGAHIDPAIMNAVVGLNALGVNTEASCEGHLDHGNAHPWIRIGAPDTDTLEDKLREARQKVLNASEGEREQVFATYSGLEACLKPLHMHEWDKVIDLLDSFYEWHTAPCDSRLIVSDLLGSGQFFLQSQGAVRQDTRDAKLKAAKLKACQDEMRAFAAFLKKRFLGEDVTEQEYPVGQAADLLGMRHRTLTSHIERGRLVARKKGRDYYISHEELERFKNTPRKVGRPTRKSATIPDNFLEA